MGQKYWLAEKHHEKRVFELFFLNYNCECQKCSTDLRLVCLRPSPEVYAPVGVRRPRHGVLGGVPVLAGGGGGGGGGGVGGRGVHAQEVLSGSGL